jgi:hypothetical protein
LVRLNSLPVELILIARLRRVSPQVVRRCAVDTSCHVMFKDLGDHSYGEILYVDSGIVGDLTTPDCNLE